MSERKGEREGGGGEENNTITSRLAWEMMLSSYNIINDKLASAVWYIVAMKLFTHL